MIILPEFNKPYIIENTHSPVVAKSYWGFSSTLVDFKLFPLAYLEETEGASYILDFNGFQVSIPYNWYIMISDEETLQLDFIPISECLTSNISALIISLEDTRFRLSPIKIVDFSEQSSLVHPLIQKSCALLHPVNQINFETGTTALNVIIGPHDLYKQIGNLSFGDLI